MRIRGIYFGAGLGATAYEIQVHKLVVRLLRPGHWFWPYRHLHFKDLIIWPEFVTFKLHKEQA
jgi:hypothetical protein